MAFEKLNVNDLIGKVYGHFIILADAKEAKGHTKVIVRCVCGVEKSIRLNSLRTGNTTSCGCMKASRIGDARRRHGLSTTTECTSWYHMIDRCYNKNNDVYSYYGGRGIKVCERWLNSFTDFLKDMGNKPALYMSLDRINVDGDYEPSNCRWATPQVQTENRRCMKA